MIQQEKDDGPDFIAVIWTLLGAHVYSILLAKAFLFYPLEDLSFPGYISFRKV